MATRFREADRTPVCHCVRLHDLLKYEVWDVSDVSKWIDHLLKFPLEDVLFIIQITWLA